MINSNLFRRGQNIKALEDDLNELFQINVLGNVPLFNIFLPLIKNGQTKKVVTISSGMSDEKLAVEFELFEAAPYSISKSAMNMVTAKFQGEFKKEGIIFMGVCPGNVTTGHYDNRKYAVCKVYYRILIGALPHSHPGKSAETYDNVCKVCCVCISP
jgi:NAD(P)-dependent dehydrogenase (short-subunit alcohol dehydrogenase family)